MTVHQRFERLAAMAIDFEPTPAQRLELAAHIATCRDCRRADQVFRTQAIDLRDRVRTLPSAELRNRVLAHVSVARVRTRDISSLRLLGVAAAISLLAIGSVLTVGSRTQPTPTTAPTTAPAANVTVGGLPLVGDVTALDVPAGHAAHDHHCHVIVESDCAAAIAATSAAIWTTSSTGIVRLDPNSGVVVRTDGAGAFPHRMTTTPDGSVWVALGDRGRLVRIPAAGLRVVEAPSADIPSQMVVSGDRLWVVRPRTKQVEILDAASGQSLGSRSVDGTPWGVVDLDGAIWVVEQRARMMWQLDPDGPHVKQTIDLTGGPGSTLTIDEQAAGALARVSSIQQPIAAFGKIWIPGNDAMLVVDPAASRLWAVGLPTVSSVAAAPGGVVVVSRANRVIELIDPVSMQVSARQDLLMVDWDQWDLPATATSDGSVWLRDYVRDRVLRIRPR
jgi:hypothetical protein